MTVFDVGIEAPDRRATYDAFVSYSHAADDLLAPRLQAGLQRFAKPWWKRRALHVFRDESSLSASPHLWGSIVAAMEGSAWFVLLLSPEAASSPWVDREIAWWVANKEPGRIIPVLTDGTFAWGSLTRGFTEFECKRFNFGDDCPTLEELREGWTGTATANPCHPSSKKLLVL